MVAVRPLLEAAAAFLGRPDCTASPATRGLVGVFRDHASEHRVDRLVVGTRLAFAVCALLAVGIDPSQPAGNDPYLLGVVLAYALYSLATIVWTWWSAAGLSQRARHGTLVVDVGVALIIMSLSGGTKSPFFSFMVFPLLAATLRWRWRGALWAGGVSLAACGGMALYTAIGSGNAALELDSLILEGVYLVIVTVVLAYLAHHDDGIRREMGALATWTTSPAGEADGRLSEMLRHVASVVGAPRVLLVWQAADEPRPTLASWAAGKFHCDTDEAAALEALVAGPVRDSNFVCRDAAQADARVVCMTEGLTWRWRGSPLGEGFRSTFAIRAVIAVRLQEAPLRGRLFVLDKRAATSDDLVLATVVSRQVENALGHDYLARQLREATLAHERARIARDVHDGALQWLAAAAIRLETIRRQFELDPAPALEALRELQNMITLQQRELRSFVHELQTGASTKNLALLDLLTEVALRIEREWQLAVKLDVKVPPELFDTISPELAREIQQIIREALVNVARHTLASVVCVGIWLDGDFLWIRITDNGQGFPFRGRLETADLAARNLGPVMLRQRIVALGGTLAIDSSDDGAHLEISVPWRGTLRAVDRVGSSGSPSLLSDGSGPPRATWQASRQDDPRSVSRHRSSSGPSAEQRQDRPRP